MHTIPVFCSNNPFFALNQVKDVLRDDTVTRVVVFEIKDNAPNKLVDFEDNQKTIYVASRLHAMDEIKEEFFEKHMYMKRKQVDTMGSQDRASSGKYRAIVSFDHDYVVQIGDDVSSREQALDLCMMGGGNDGNLYQVFNDKGEPQIKDNKFLELKVA